MVEADLLLRPGRNSAGRKLETFPPDAIPTCNCDVERTGYAQRWFHVQSADGLTVKSGIFDPYRQDAARSLAKRLQKEKPSRGPYRVVAVTREQIYETRNKA